MMQRKKGQRVFMELEHEQTKETRRRYGTVESDEIEFWDYTDVRFDDNPAFVSPVLTYYLFEADTGTT